ncbi:hypothetical protein C5167_022033 [Papaver somniferum]|uniref:Uncharacterized protein n=1 Tax=Papaver somniferum TaxID=3469 RepID=A0A4Y7JKS0_PAPSO|nr:hypothetical protein C5167_022033 [Papaver somniferum]
MAMVGFRGKRIILESSFSKFQAGFSLLRIRQYLKESFSGPKSCKSWQQNLGDKRKFQSLPSSSKRPDHPRNIGRRSIMRKNNLIIIVRGSVRKMIKRQAEWLLSTLDYSPSSVSIGRRHNQGFEQYPEFLSSKFYISGECYAGIYVPTLASEVVKGNYPY